MMRASLTVRGVLALSLFLLALTVRAEDYAAKIAPLIDPTKLATLAERGANPRVQKYVAQLAEAQKKGIQAGNVVTQAVALAGMKGEAAKLTAEAMLRNLTIAERLGCLDKAGLRDMRRGQSPTIRRGPCKGDQLSVDHIIPRAVCPELDNVIANLELMPMRMNAGKRDRIGERQLSFAENLCRAGLLSREGLGRVKQAALKR